MIAIKIKIDVSGDLVSGVRSKSVRRARAEDGGRGTEGRGLSPRRAGFRPYRRTGRAKPMFMRVL